MLCVCSTTHHSFIMNAPSCIAKQHTHTRTHTHTHTHTHTPNTVTLCVCSTTHSQCSGDVVGVKDGVATGGSSTASCVQQTFPATTTTPATIARGAVGYSMWGVNIYGAVVYCTIVLLILLWCGDGQFAICFYYFFCIIFIILYFLFYYYYYYFFFFYYQPLFLVCE